MSEVRIIFENDAQKDEFKGWFSDGGGEYAYFESCEMRDLGSIMTRYEGDTVRVFECEDEE